MCCTIKLRAFISINYKAIISGNRLINNILLFMLKFIDPSTQNVLIMLKISTANVLTLVFIFIFTIKKIKNVIIEKKPGQRTIVSNIRVNCFLKPINYY